MRILLIVLLSSFLTLNLSASEEKSVQELFTLYESIFNDKKVELIDEVFTKKFIQTSGGKEEFIKKIKSLPSAPRMHNKNFSKLKKIWRKSHRREVYFVKIQEPSTLKSKPNLEGSEFIVLKEDGKLKIDGTLSDGN